MAKIDIGAAASAKPTRVQLDATRAAFQSVQPLTDMVSTLVEGNSFCLNVISDSLRNAPSVGATDAFESIWRLGQGIAASLGPDLCVMYKPWNTNQERYDPWQIIQAGSNGQRHLFFPPVGIKGRHIPRAAIPYPTTRAIFEVDLALNWNKGTTQQIVGVWRESTSRGIRLVYTTDKKFRMQWSTTGSDSVVSETVAQTLTDYERFWVKADLDTTTGAVSIARSSDGVAWSSLKTETKGATSIFSPDADPTTGVDWQIGCRQQSSDLADGRIYEVRIRDADNGKILNPQPIDSWMRFGGLSDEGCALAGSPTLYLVNGSRPGADTAYHMDAARQPKIMEPYFPCVRMFNSQRNEAIGGSPLHGKLFLERYDAWIASMLAIDNKNQLVGLVIPPQADPNMNEHSRAQSMELRSYFRRNRISFVDVMQRFLNEAAKGVSYNSLFNIDLGNDAEHGVHYSNPVGYELEAKSLLNASGISV